MRLNVRKVPKEFNALTEYIKNPDIFSDSTKWPADLVKDRNLRDEDKIFLVETGIPEWAAPHLSFGEIGVWAPKLEDWEWKNDSIPELPPNVRNEFVIGSNYDPICLDAQGELYLIDNTNGFEKVAVSSNLHALLYSLAVYGTAMQINLRLKRNRNYHGGGSIPLTNYLANEILSLISSFDAPIAGKKSFWEMEVQESLDRGVRLKNLGHVKWRRFPGHDELHKYLGA